MADFCTATLQTMHLNQVPVSHKEQGHDNDASESCPKQQQAESSQNITHKRTQEHQGQAEETGHVHKEGR